MLRVDCKGSRDFVGSIRYEGCDNISIAELKASSHVAERHPYGLARDDDEFAVAFLQLEGQMRVRTGDREHVVRPGDMFFYDARTPVALDFPGSFRHLFIRAPWSRWGYNAPPALRDSICASNGEPLLHIAGAASLALLDSCAADDVATEKRDSAIAAVVNLLSETVAGFLTPLDLTPAELALTRRFEKLLADRLQDSELNVETLAHELGVSSRYLNRVLVRSGGPVSRRIFEGRLKFCAEEFRRNPNARIGDIAYRWGFSDTSHFSRAFKTFYGISPRRFKAQSLRQTA